MQNRALHACHFQMTRVISQSSALVLGVKTGEHRGMHQFIGSAKAAIKENPQTHEKPQF